MNLDTYCPKCNSERVKIRLKEKPKEPERLSMDDLPNKRKLLNIYAVILIKHYIATCKNCGYFVHWSE